MRQVSGNTLQQVETLKYLGVLRVTKAEAEEINTRIGKANAVLRELYRSVGTKRELSNTAKLLQLQTRRQLTLAMKRQIWHD